MVLIEGYVMYRIVIHANVYRRWQVYTDWGTNGYDGGFGDFCMDRYPEVLVRSAYVGGGIREFEFESEDHYNWFLLQVM